MLCSLSEWHFGSLQHQHGNMKSHISLLSLSSISDSNASSSLRTSICYPVSTLWQTTFTRKAAYGDTLAASSRFPEDVSALGLSVLLGSEHSEVRRLDVPWNVLWAYALLTLDNTGVDDAHISRCCRVDDENDSFSSVSILKKAIRNAVQKRLVSSPSLYRADESDCLVGRSHANNAAHA